MNITSAKYADADNKIISCTINGLQVDFLAVDDYKEYTALQSWLAAGNTIEAYKPPSGE